MNIDHYAVLGLPSGEEGARLSDKEIAKAYRIKALELHPDKRPNDPNAQINFQKLKASYEILKDEKARKQFDDLLRARRGRTTKSKCTNDAKREKMMADLERAERGEERRAEKEEEEEEERIWKKLREEIAEIRAKHKRKQEEELASMYAKRRKAAAAATPPPMPPPRWREETEDGPWKSLERFQAYEDLVLQNLRRAAERQKMAQRGTNCNGN